MNKHNADNNNKKIPAMNIVMALTVPLVIIMAFILPVALLKKNSTDIVGKVTAAPEEYYKNMSAPGAENSGDVKLGEYHNMKLITGVWDSLRTPVGEEEMQSNKAHMINKAIIFLDQLYLRNLYPVNVSKAEYTCSAEPMKAVDMAFGSYTAYYWIISFSKEGSLEKVVFTDEGEFLAAYSESDKANDFNSRLSSFNITALFKKTESYDSNVLDAEDGDVEEFEWFADLEDLPVQGYANIRFYSEQDLFVLYTMGEGAADYYLNIDGDMMLPLYADFDIDSAQGERKFDLYKVLTAGDSHRYFIGVLPEGSQ